MATGYVEAPQDFDGAGVTVFLAGGITGVEDWQKVAAQELRDHAVVLNPRQSDFPLNDEVAMARQVKWEFEHLGRATIVMFWFSPMEVQPIALLELGAYAYAGLGAKRVVVGTDPAYSRRKDIVLQLRHARPDLMVHQTLEETISQARSEVTDCRTSIFRNSLAR